MSEAVLEELGDGRFALRGPLDYSNAAALLAEGERAFREHPRIELDLSGVTRANSAALALLLEWMDGLRARGASLQLAAPPASLRAIAGISNLLDLLPLESD